MTTVFIEARPKGRPEGSPIEDFVVEEKGDRVRKTFKTQEEAITWGEGRGARPPRGARPASERQENPGPLAPGLALAPHLGGRLVFPQPDIDRVAKQTVPRPGKIGDLGDKLRLDPVHPRQHERRSEPRLARRRHIEG